MKFTWILALVMAASSFALETYECKDLYGLPGRASYFIVPIGTRERASYTEYDDKKICERDAAQMEAHGNAHKKKPMPKDDEGDNAGGFVETLVGLMNDTNTVKQVKEAKWCK